MPKIIQIAASTRDLYGKTKVHALCDCGNIYRYYEETEEWSKLPPIPDNLK